MTEEPMPVIDDAPPDHHSVRGKATADSRRVRHEEFEVPRLNFDELVRHKRLVQFRNFVVRTVFVVHPTSLTYVFYLMNRLSFKKLRFFHTAL